MLKCNPNRINIIVIFAVVLLMSLGTIGQAAPVAPSSVFVSGTENVKDQLLAEAVLLVKQAGLNAGSFDLGNAISSPDGKALFVAIKTDKAFKEQIGRFNQNQQRELVVGLLYTREAFEFQGKKYDRGLHPILLENLDAPLSSSLGVSIFKQRCTGPCTIQGRRQIDGGGAIVVSCAAASGGSCDLSENNNTHAPSGGGGPGGKSDFQNKACALTTGLAIGLGVASPVVSPWPAVVVGSLAGLLCG